MRASLLSVLLLAALVAAKGPRGSTRSCGAGQPPCSNNDCCSADGHCGRGKDFCVVKSGCQPDYGRCRGVKKPPTTTTPPPTTNGRPARPSGGAPARVIETCSQPGVVAITFDDGPSTHTAQLLDTLANSYPDVHVTFFVNGNNYVDARTPQYQAVIARAFQAGHQIASHTFEHKDLAKLDDGQIRDQMLLNDDVIYTATGRVPRYMRPPYGSVNAAALAVLGNLGFVVVTWDVDTQDWDTDSADKSFAVYDKALASGRSFIPLQHDTMVSTTTQLMDRVIPAIRARGLRMVTVAECLGDAQPYL